MKIDKLRYIYKDKNVMPTNDNHSDEKRSE